jgi:hypothetical protein
MNSKTGMSIVFSFCFWQSSNKKEAFITSCPKMGKCNKSLKLPVTQRAFLPGCRCATAHRFCKTSALYSLLSEKYYTGFCTKVQEER